MLTRSGLGAVVTALVLAGLGWRWGYEELVILSAAIGGLVLMAIWASQRPLRASVSRRVATARVARGDPIVVAYRLHNNTRFRSGRATIIDRCDGQEIRVPTTSVLANSTMVVHGQLPTRRRGVFDVGPLEIERIDPFWLTVGSRRSGDIASVIVHPKVHALVGPHGAVRAVENESILRRASADPMSGFVSMREYVAGDDPRMIHWPTTARTGTLMVREHVEVRRPEFTIVLDASERVGTPDDFEESVDVAASLAIHAIRSGLDVVVRTTNRHHAGRRTPIVSEGTVLDLLTTIQQVPQNDVLSLSSLFAGGFDHTSVLMVTGPAGPSSRFGSAERLTAVRIGAGSTAGHDVAIAAHDAIEFVERWRMRPGGMRWG